jgi:hypothetical protein
MKKIDCQICNETIKIVEFGTLTCCGNQLCFECIDNCQDKRLPCPFCRGNQKLAYLVLVDPLKMFPTCSTGQTHFPKQESLEPPFSPIIEAPPPPAHHHIPPPPVTSNAHQVPPQVEIALFQFGDLYQKFNQLLENMKSMVTKYPCQCYINCTHKFCQCWKHNPDQTFRTATEKIVETVSSMKGPSEKINQFVENLGSHPPHQVIDLLNGQFFENLGLVKSFSSIDYLPVDPSIDFDENIDYCEQLDEIIKGISQL